MSAPPPPTPPGEPHDAARKERNNALVWTVLAAAFAVFLFVYSANVDPEKKNLYLIGGGVGAVVAAINGYNAWTLFQKSKQPPKA
jgi:hypothetical protein